MAGFQKNTGGALSPAHVRALVAVLSSPTLGEAARAAHVPERTLRRWLRLPAFQAELRARSDDALAAVTARMQAETLRSVAVLVELRDGAHPASVRLRAAVAILEGAAALADVAIADRLDALERARSETEDEGERRQSRWKAEWERRNRWRDGESGTARG